MPRQVLLTFDTEDFINDRSIRALSVILKLLKKYNIKALFFITGHMAEKLSLFPQILDLLEAHEIGFHSSSHSVHPTIFEYCDVEIYRDAYLTSLKRETSYINPLSGEIEGIGGILRLKELFPSKSIVAYRAPGYCCPPPHLEAMVTLGIKYDFSWNLSEIPVRYKEITFYPLPIFLDCTTQLLMNNHLNWVKFLRSLSTEKITVLNFHPNSFVNLDWWDSIYFNGNPPILKGVQQRETRQIKTMFKRFETLLKIMRRLERSAIISTFPTLSESKIKLDTNKVNVKKLWDMFIFWPKTFFNYRPRHLLSQFSVFFNL